MLDFAPPSLPCQLHSQLFGIPLKKLIDALSPCRVRDSATPRGRVVPVRGIPPSKLPVNDPDDFVPANDDIGWIQVTVSEDRCGPRTILLLNHVFDVYPVVVNFALGVL